MMSHDVFDWLAEWLFGRRWAVYEYLLWDAVGRLVGEKKEANRKKGQMFETI